MTDGGWVGDHVSTEDADVEADAGPKRPPAEIRCFDRARLCLKAGDGGNGAVAFLREKYRPMGGPAGGNGGRGGSIYAVVDPSLNSLLPFRKKIHYRAGDGLNGGGKSMHGSAGPDLTVGLPPGSIIKLADRTVELVDANARVLLLAGGEGGRGNASFKSGKNRAPQLCEHGEAGSELWVDVELKLVADVGIVGVPNAGKSTLLSAVSAAKPKIADYPFTTLVPNLGVCNMDYGTTVFADIPGLLEGAHAGVGLGLEFLRHTERCRLLLHLLDGSSPDAAGDYAAIQQELALFNPAVAAKQQIVVLNKIDLPEARALVDTLRASFAARGVPFLAISAATHEGVAALVSEVRRTLAAMPLELPAAATTSGAADDEGASVDVSDSPSARPVAGRLPFEEFTVEGPIARASGGREWIVWGAALERLAQMTNWEYYESTTRFQRVLEVAGVTRALRRAGVAEGDSVALGNVMEFDWIDDADKGRAYERWLEGKRQTKGGTRWPHGG